MSGMTTERLRIICDWLIEYDNDANRKRAVSAAMALAVSQGVTGGGYRARPTGAVEVFASPTLTDAERALLRRLQPSETPFTSYSTVISPEDRKTVFGLLKRLGGET